MSECSILIVEDDTVAAENLTEILDILGYRVSGAVSTAEEAFLAVGNDTPRIVLMDISLRGGMDGIEAARQIRNRFDIPVVYLTGFSDQALLDRAKETEPYGYLVKPIEMNALRTVIEITLYKHQIDRRLKESEERYRNLFDNAPVGIFQVTEDGGFLSVNPAQAHMLGYESPEDLMALAKNFAFDVWAKPEEFKKLIERLSVRDQVVNLDTAFLRRNGDTLTGNLRCQAVRNADGSVRWIEGIFEDVTDRKNAEDALRESEEKYRSVVEHMQDVFYRTDMEGIITMISPSVREMLGYDDVDRIIGLKHDKDFYADPADREGMLAEIREKGSVRNFELELVGRSGESVIVLTNSHIYYDKSGRPLGIEGVFADVTGRKRAEHALRESEEKYRILIEKAQEAITVHQDGMRKFVNPAAAKIWERSEEVLLSQPISEFIHPDDREMVMGRAMQRLRGENPPSRYPYRIVTEDGRIKWVELSSTLFSWEGKPALLVLATDINERKQAEEALRESEEKYRRVFNNAAVGILLSTESGRILQENATFRNMLGYTEEELRTISILDLTFAEDREFSKEKLDALYNGQLGEYRLEKRYVKKDGTIVWVDLSVSAIRDTEDRHVATIGVISNITDRKRAEEALRESQRQYRSLFEESADGVYSVLRNGEITDANPAFLEMFGYTRDEMLGMDIHELYMDPYYRSTCQEELERKGFIKDYEVHWRKKDGTEIDVILTLSVHYGKDGSIIGYQGIARDVTERKMLEKQLLQAQKMESIGTLTGGIAHDFNNLLTIINGYAELVLMDKAEDDPIYEDVKKILETGRKGADLVQSLLSFTKQAATNRKPVDLNQRIEENKKLMDRSFPKTITIEADLSGDLWMVSADTGQIDQILMNLCLNARDAMPDGGLLRIETKNVMVDEAYCRLQMGAHPGGHVLVEISDTGTGMKKETIDRMFDPFFTTKGWDFKKGTGLSLPVAKGIVEQHGGWITCQSELGKGTKFGLYIPAIEESALGNKPEGGTETVSLTGSILLVDDEEHVRDLGKRILERSGFTVVTASNGKQALDIYSKERSNIWLVVLDLVMPQMGGEKCLEGLLAIDPEVRVVISSGHSLTAREQDSLATHVKGFVEKPYPVKEFLDIVQKVMYTA